MERTFLDRVKEWWWGVRNTHAVSKIPWSAIRRIGQSRLLALTIVVPFLGSLLMFNQAVVDVLTLSPELVRRWFHLTVENSADAARKLTLARLYYVYFGLTFLGVGSSLFVLFCPLDIKNYSTAIEYQTTEAPLVSKPKMTLIFPFIAYEYSRWMGDEVNRDSLGFMRGLGQPDDFHVLFSAVISEMYGDSQMKGYQTKRENRSKVTLRVTAIHTKTSDIGQTHPKSRTSSILARGFK